MNFNDILEVNAKAGLYTLVKDKNDNFQLFSTRDGNGNLRISGWRNTEKKAVNFQGCSGHSNGYSAEDINEYVKNGNWKVVRTIHPIELMPCNYEEGQKVKILPNAEKECERLGFSWNIDREQMAEDGFGFIDKRNGSDWEIWDKDKTNYYWFPETCIAPFIEEEKEEEMVNIKISKSTLEELRKIGIKVIEK